VTAEDITRLQDILDRARHLLAHGRGKHSREDAEEYLNDLARELDRHWVEMVRAETKRETA
jgi:hypothetical protein